LSPNFASLYPTGSRPAPYDADDLLKVAVIMTDGEFNTGYCNHTVSRESSANVTPTTYRSNCYATNGDPADQAEALCEAMKRDGIVIYTVGFDLRENRALEVLENCASGSGHFYVAEDGTDLQLAFQAIGTEISRLRIAE
jgi:hypothetical protein